MVFVAVVLGLTTTSATDADLVDRLEIANNRWKATTLDFSSRNTVNDGQVSYLFNVNGLKPGGFDVKSIRVKNDGQMRTGYEVKPGRIGGSGELCEALDLKVFWQWRVIYEGKMKDLAVEISGEMETREKDDSVWVLSLGEEERGLAGESCNFQLVFTTKTGGGGFFDEEILENTVSHGGGT